MVLFLNSCKKNDIPTAKNIYVAGSQWNGTNYVATYWRNGIPTHLSDGTKSILANSIFVSGSDIYVAGEEDYLSSLTGSVAKYWKNGVVTNLPADNQYNHANAIFVVGNDIYIAGYEQGNSFSSAKYWKNGVAVRLTMVAETLRQILYLLLATIYTLLAGRIQLGITRELLNIGKMVLQ
jgi:hypothetical protein